MNRTKNDILRIYNPADLCAAEACEFLEEFKGLFKMTSAEIEAASDWLRERASDDEINAFVEMVKKCILEMTNN